MSELDWASPYRAAIPVCKRCVYLNAGSVGPTPEPVAAAMREQAAYETELGRGNFVTFPRMFDIMDQARREVAQLLNCSAEEVALTHNTGEGVNIALWGIDWQPGDEIVTTNHEHDAVAVPLGVLRDRFGVRLQFVDIADGANAGEVLCNAVTERTRMLIVSHVLYTTGASLPIAELGQHCRSRGVLFVVDGAQAVGAQPVDVGQLNADVYTVSGQKWLCGPEGTGALFLAKHSAPRIKSSYASFFSAQKHDFRGNVKLHPGARRFETGTVYRPGIAGFSAAITWLRDKVGLARAFEHSLRLAKHARQALEQRGLQVVTPEGNPSQLLSFDVPQLNPAQMFAMTMMLAEQRNVILRSTVTAPYVVRLSLGFFNTVEDVDRALSALDWALAMDPTQIPISGYAETLPRSRD